MTQLRKGELIFYRGFEPKEFKKFIKQYPKNEDQVKLFLDNYRFDYVQKKWRKL